MITDREEFAIGAALLGVAAAVLATVTATGWGIPVMASLVVLMVVRARWRSMPNWLMLLWTGAAVVPVEAAGLCGNGYFVALVAMALAVANRVSPLEGVLVAALTASPIALWALGAQKYEDFGPWTWVAGMAIGVLFGAVVARQWNLIDELTATRHQLADAAADAERQRIAREMHDVVGHSFSVVLLHLSGARTVLDSDPGRAADALRRAEDVGRRGMEDLRQTIGLLRTGSESLQPVPDAADLAALIDDCRSAGLDITTRIEGTVDDVAGASRIVAHDVVREALTNCAKHAPTAPVELGVEVSQARVDISVRNERVDATPTTDGAGLTGLRQRVEALRGRFSAGPEAGSSGWVVEARIPRHVEVTDRLTTDAGSVR